MRCPYCREDNDQVVDSRTASDGTSIRRRRRCKECGRRFTTYERHEIKSRMVVKKNDTCAAYSRDKVLRGMITACEKRQVGLPELNEAIDAIESELFDGQERAVPTSRIGQKVSDALRELDHVAYVRFTSVYREFADIREFLETLTPLLKDNAPGDGEPAAGDAGNRPREEPPEDPESREAPA